jgi:hypothetical protein
MSVFVLLCFTGRIIGASRGSRPDPLVVVKAASTTSATTSQFLVGTKTGTVRGADVFSFPVGGCLITLDGVPVSSHDNRKFGNTVDTATSVLSCAA